MEHTRPLQEHEWSCSSKPQVMCAGLRLAMEAVRWPLHFTDSQYQAACAVRDLYTKKLQENDPCEGLDVVVGPHAMGFRCPIVEAVVVDTQYDVHLLHEATEVIVDDFDKAECNQVIDCYDVSPQGVAEDANRQ